ncbi:MAG: hypothetical protein ABSB67_01450 [Bryobacteraceae bacterium]|jgi:hypothetical protein
MTVNVAPEAPAGTVTEVGTPTKALLDDNATTEPLPGAGAEIVTVHVALAPEATEIGEHVRLDTAAAVTVRDAVAVVPFSEAVRVAN